jgi:hypothetical protein
MEALMTCKLCASSNQQQFQTEIAIHAHTQSKPLIFVFPKILVCMNCGGLEPAERFVVPEVQLRLLGEE